jgi:hypothetical protein
MAKKQRAKEEQEPAPSTEAQELAIFVSSQIIGKSQH